ncbi:MAG: polysaccharide deacetylase family protein, partial [Bacteroidota bacterium]
PGGSKWISAVEEKLNSTGYPDGTLKERLLAVRYRDQAVLDELGGILGHDFDQFLVEYRPYMTWEQVRDLQKKGFSIGAHSLDHPEYRFLSLEEQIRQTELSLQAVRDNTTEKLESFAFPFTDFGVSRAFFEHFGMGKSKGDMLVMMGSAGLKRDTFPRHVQRLPMEGPSDDATTILKSHYLYYLLKMLLGKNRIHRT